MAYNNDNQLFEVDCTCAKCGANITQLPFQPSGDRPVYCIDCNRAFRQNKRDNQRQMFQVNLKCSTCGIAITQLPFMPKGDNPINCRDCYMKNRG